MIKRANSCYLVTLMSNESNLQRSTLDRIEVPEVFKFDDVRECPPLDMHTSDINAIMKVSLSGYPYHIDTKINTLSNKIKSAFTHRFIICPSVKLSDDATAYGKVAYYKLIEVMRDQKINDLLCH